MVELCKSPIDETELEGRSVIRGRFGIQSCVGTYGSLFVVNHDVVGLDITMHDTLGMTEVQSLIEANDA